MSSSDDNLQNKRTVGRNRKLQFCSTPLLVEKSYRPSSISISAVEANSSSSGPRTWRGSRGQTVEKTLTKKQRKKKRKGEPKARRQKRHNAAEDSGSEWETKLEQSVHEEEIPQRVSTQKAASTAESVLFKDMLGSPERIRDAPHFFNDDRFESPVFRPLRRELESPEKISFKENEGMLVVEDLPTCQADVDEEAGVDEEADSKELILRKSNTVVTYPGTRQEKRPKISEKIVECQVLMEKVWYPKATANLLWDNFVKENYEKVGKFIGRSALNEHQESRSNKGGECSDSNKNQSIGKTVFENSGPIKPDLRKISVARGYRSRSSKKWVRVEELYKFPQPEDPEFQKRDRRGRKMTLNEYLRKCRMEKENLKHCSLDPCSSVASQNSEGSRRRMNDLGMIEKGASPCKNLEHEFEKSKVRSRFTRASLKRVNNSDIDGSDAKRRVIPKNKPTIRMIEPIPNKYYESVQRLRELCETDHDD
ncbi:uncharacterized protein LOC143375289 [Andrena cerasifolii]|uniref:uncharacterized protein LOC143375289 n=1 Tax=Andrena cerasifolii TaxID=2819439 RepID=UPI004037F03C